MKTFTKIERQAIFAILLGPLAIFPAMIFAMTIMFLLSPSNPPDLLNHFKGGLLVSFFGLLYSYGFTILYGIPVYLILLKYNKNNLYTVLLASLAPAITLGILNTEVWPFYAAMAYFSIVVGFTCWYIAVHINNKSSNKSFKTAGQKTCPARTPKSGAV